MNPILGTLNDHPMVLPSFEPTRPVPPWREVRNQPSGEEPGSSSDSTSILPFPYLALLRSLVEQGRIRDARNLLESAGDFVPQDSKIRDVLSPPRVRQSDKRDFDRSAEFRWLDENGVRFRGKWVALLGERLVTSAETLKDLLTQLRATPPEGKPLVHHVD